MTEQPKQIAMKLPLRADGDFIYDAKNKRVATICGASEWPIEADEAHAAFFVSAVNAHAELVAALETALRMIDARSPLPPDDNEAFKRMRAAISRARGETP